MSRFLVLVLLSVLAGCIFKASPDPVSASDADVGGTDDVGSAEDGSTEDDMVVMIEPDIVFVVTRAADDVDDANCFEDDCTLRQAMNAALAQTERVAITFADNLYEQTIVLGSDLPTLTRCHVIDANADPSFGLMTITAPTSTAPVFRFDGLRCRDNEFAAVRGIRFEDTPVPAVIITDSDRVLVERNMMDDTGIGVGSDPASSNIWVLDNIIINSRRHGAVLYGTEILFERNFVGVLPDDNPGPNVGHGVVIGATNTLVSDNTISENGLDGLVIDVRNPGDSVDVIHNTFGTPQSDNPQKASVVVYNGEVVIGGERQQAGVCDGPCNRFVSHEEFGVLVANVEDASVIYGNVFGEGGGEHPIGIGIGRLRDLGASCETGAVCESGACMRENLFDQTTLGGRCVAACEVGGPSCPNNSTCRRGGCVPDGADSPDVDTSRGEANTLNIGSGTLSPTQAAPALCIGTCNLFLALDACAIESDGPLLLNIFGNQFGGDEDDEIPRISVCTGQRSNNAAIAGNVISATNVALSIDGFQNTIEDNLILAPEAFSFPETGWFNRAEGNTIDADLTQGDSGFATFEDNNYLGGVGFTNALRAPSLQATRSVSNIVQVTLSDLLPNVEVGLIAVTTTGASHVQTTCFAESDGDAGCSVPNLAADQLIAFSKVPMRVYDVAGTNGASYIIEAFVVPEASPPYTGAELATIINNNIGYTAAFELSAPENQLGARIGILTHLGHTLSGDVMEIADGEVFSSFSDPTMITADVQ